jgi:lipopolysaccharide/colanic/teichoic acid biosynthesis glycosyltransferase
LSAVKSSAGRAGSGSCGVFENFQDWKFRILSRTEHFPRAGRDSSLSLGTPIYRVFGGIMVKRGVDIFVSALLLCLTSPILLLSVLIIRISSPGPVFFRQVRMGRKFEPFEVIKLRTMAHALPGLAYTLGPDPRITPFGRWLRRTKIDELPQLWNVLRGQMSMVGPRPVLPELTSEFRFHYKLLLRERPGITDPASLKYCQETRLLALAHEPMRFFKNVVTPDKIEISLEYMDSANLWTDAVTLFMTGLICCFPPLSRVYGRLPTPATLPMKREPCAVPAFRVAPTASDGSIFSHSLAELEAVEEMVPAFASQPWNLLRMPGLVSQSTTLEEKGRDSHL